MRIFLSTVAVLFGIVLPVVPAASEDDIRSTVDTIVKPLMAEYQIPGLSVGILLAGQHHVSHYGVSSRETASPVDGATLFEIGSLSKPFTGTLLARLQAEGSVSLSTQVKELLPELSQSPIGAASLLELHTYVAGGLPLQFPAEVNEQNFISFYKSFIPTTKIGTSRLYSNTSIGLSGYLAAKSVDAPFASLLDEKVIKPLNLAHTFLSVPKDRVSSYAQGYTSSNAPVRVNPGLFDDEAYGIKTTAADLLDFVEASANPNRFDGSLKAALIAARSPVYQARRMYQGLGWELYRAPARRGDLLQGVDPDFVLKANQIDPPSLHVPAEMVATVSKTGSTGGFGAYVLFQPERGTGIVILANRFWPNSARIATAYSILGKLDPGFFAD
ncbi:beta-lactamase class C [Rhizobium sp. NFR07]|uniref:class C beta-lactamase n=1 Tax=Rhizobium sp. NFR07 TaxID=1566262 RepID=UPI0008EE9CE5|nr:class C beta-lactamase [Rhizobium sp. NFR07]SFB56600.1 beta-lactamase class C [Rhizobium sp. NFR07]